jgi:hypothetical protein
VAPVVLAISTVVLTLAGCGSDDDKAERPPGCGMLSEKTVTVITGTPDVFSTGGLGPRDDAGGNANCQIVSASTPDVYAQLYASDEKIEDTQALFAEEKGKEKGCTSLTDLPEGGYLCVRADEADAAVALPGRLVRITVTADGQMDQATPENVVAWAQEIDEHLTPGELAPSSAATSSGCSAETTR